MATLDDVSLSIGRLLEAVDGLKEDITDNRKVADRRHEENKQRFETIEKTLSGLASDRRVAVVGISAVTAGVMWLGSHILPFLWFKK